MYKTERQTSIIILYVQISGNICFEKHMLMYRYYYNWYYYCTTKTTNILPHLLQHHIYSSKMYYTWYTLVQRLSQIILLLLKFKFILKVAQRLRQIFEALYKKSIKRGRRTQSIEAVAMAWCRCGNCCQGYSTNSTGDFVRCSKALVSTKDDMW